MTPGNRWILLAPRGRRAVGVVASRACAAGMSPCRAISTGSRSSLGKRRRTWRALQPPSASWQRSVSRDERSPDAFGPHWPAMPHDHFNETTFQTLHRTCVAAAMGVAAPASAQVVASTPPRPDVQGGFAQAKVEADAQYKIDKDACSSQSATRRTSASRGQGQGQDRQGHARPPREHGQGSQSARVVHAQADYDVAIQVCDDQAATEGRLREGSESRARQGQGRRQVDASPPIRPGRCGKRPRLARKRARRSATRITRVALEKCDALAGPRRIPAWSGRRCSSAVPDSGPVCRAAAITGGVGDQGVAAGGFLPGVFSSVAAGPGTGGRGSGSGAVRLW